MRGHHDVFAYAEVAQGPAHLDRGAALVLDLVHDDEQVDVAPTVVRAAGARAEEQDARRLETCHNALHHGVDDGLVGHCAPPARLGQVACTAALTAVRFKRVSCGHLCARALYPRAARPRPLRSQAESKSMCAPGAGRIDVKTLGPQAILMNDAFGCTIGL
ncbi:MAG: hypothetical protein OXH93_06870 [Caldilineaceae bacterium]|nr:hypothetical protein [Caldilineaceae bacterium]